MRSYQFRNLSADLREAYAFPSDISAKSFWKESEENVFITMYVKLEHGKEKK